MRHAILLAAVVCLLGEVGSAEAQFGWGIGVGNGGWGGYGGYGYSYPYGIYQSPYGMGYGFGSYYPNYGVGPNPRYFRSRSSSGYSRGYSQPRVVVQQAQPVGDGQPIKIVGPSTPDTALSYRLNDYEYTIHSGESQLLVYDRLWVVTFDRGGEFGTAKYRLKAGTYEFTPTDDHGWELYHDADMSKLAKTGTSAEPPKNAPPPGSGSPAAATPKPTPKPEPVPTPQ